MFFVGIDLGTSSVKLILTDQNGKVLGEAGKDYRLELPQPGWKEIHPETWWEATETSLKELLRDVDASQVEGIGITGQMHTVVLLDADGNSIRPALMWNDIRTKDLIPVMKSKIEKTGVSFINKIISTGSPAAK